MKNKLLMIMVMVGMIAVSTIVVLVGSNTRGIVAADSQPVTVNVSSQQTGIWVSGQGKITVTPDVANLSLGVSAQASTVAEAQSQAATAMDRVIAALTSNGVAKKDIQTQYFNIQQMTRWDERDQKSVPTGYMVSNMVTAKIREINKTGVVIDAAAVAGGDNIRVNGVSFSVDKPEQYYVQAREKAVNDARAKAEQLAKLTGVTLGKATYINDGSPSPYGSYPAIYAKGIDMVSGGPVPETFISPGETEIMINVQINYAVQ